MADDPDEEAEVLVGIGGPVATLTIDRPQRANALRPSTMRALRRALEEVGRDPAVRVVVLTGAGQRAFCAGADLRDAGESDPAGRHRDRGELADLFRALWRSDLPTIARVRGAAVAGGMGLALACDLVVAADDATFGLPEVDVGLWPMVASVPLLRSLPPKVALELMLTGRRVDAAEGHRLGFVNRVVPAADLDAAVAELAAVLAAKPPAVVALGRRAFHDTLALAPEAALAALHPLLSVLAEADDAREGRAAFAEGRAPVWSPRPVGPSPEG